MKSSYVNDFLRLKCAGDILNIANPVQKISKEISESMAVIKKLKKIVLPYPMGYTLYDLCAGNALTSLIAIHLLPIKKAIAIDTRPRKRQWHLAKRFEYINLDIHQMNPSCFEQGSIIIGVHACTSLAERIIELYQTSKAKYLILMPCCIGKINQNYPQIVREKLGKYVIWSWQLANSCNGKFIIDEKVLSPKNAIIIAKK